MTIPFLLLWIFFPTDEQTYSDEDTTSPSLYTPAIAPSYVPMEQTPVDTATSVQEEVPQEQPSVPAQDYLPPQTAISKAYEEGYDRGYDDGEEDAVYQQGWQASFDDSNRYRGKKKADFELGYEEGYEAGYDDNLPSSDY